MVSIPLPIGMKWQSNMQVPLLIPFQRKYANTLDYRSTEITPFVKILLLGLQNVALCNTDRSSHMWQNLITLSENLRDRRAFPSWSLIPRLRWSSLIKAGPVALFNFWEKMAAIFQTTFSNAFSWMKMHEFRLRFHWSLQVQWWLRWVRSSTVKVICRYNDDQDGQDRLQ